MESKCARFCARIIYVPRNSNERCHASNSHHVTMILLDHRWEKLLDHQKMCDDVDFERLADEVF